MKLFPLLLPLVLVGSLTTLACREKSPPQPDASDVSGSSDVGDVPDAAGEPAVAYKVRTRHLDDTGKPKFTNSLAKSGSPYLLQHAHNPVDWRMWSPETLASAQAAGKPVLLSIGYSTCHWCHVMAEESFEDLEIAKYINEHYVPIKIDREERPDVDAFYMAAVQRMTGSGGWPMTVWLTPDGDVFHAATYIPPRAGARGARVGFIDVLKAEAARFQADRQAVETQAKSLTAQISQMQSAPAAGDLGKPTGALHAALENYSRSFDARHGGWGNQKFPHAARLRFLLRAADYDVKPNNALAMVTQTLDAMLSGGLYDQIGGGFHRYTTDAAWQTPHFEKMLYDNALLVRVYTEAWQRTQNPRYADVVEETVQFMLRELRAPQGGFYSALDAVSEGGEGAFYVWTVAEIEAAAPEQAEVLKAYFGVTPRGNFKDGTNVLHIAGARAELAASLDIDVATFESQLKEGRALLMKARDTRSRPSRDEKVISAWNGLAIDALAHAGFAFNKFDWINAAKEAAAALPGKNNMLRRSAVQGQMGPPAVADDFAHVAAGLLTLFEATAEAPYLLRAVLIQNQLQAHHGLPGGGLAMAGRENAGELPVRQVLYMDGALPSANGVAAMNAIRLAALRDDQTMRDSAAALVRTFGGEINSHPERVPQLLLALDWMASDTYEVAIVGPEPEPLLSVLRENYLAPYVLGRDSGVTLITWLAGKVPKSGKATAYVCRNYKCKLPTNEPDELLRQLRR